MRRPAFDIYRALVGIQDRLMQLAPEDRIRLQRHAVQKYGTAGRAVELVGGHLDEARQSLQGWRRRTSASHRRPLGLRVHAACGGREDLATVWPWGTYAPLSVSPNPSNDIAPELGAQSRGDVGSLFRRDWRRCQSQLGGAVTKNSRPLTWKNIGLRAEVRATKVPLSAFRVGRCRTR
jgi:hypothetical protein